MKLFTHLRYLLVIGMLLAAGCSTTINYDPNLAASHIKQAGRPVPGGVFVYTTQQQDAYVYAGRPTTFAGSAVVANIPFGKMTRGIALTTFDAAFLQGATAGNSIRGISGNPLIVMPSVKAFDYFYGISPDNMFKSVANVRMKLHAKVLSADAQVLLDKTYDSSRVLSEASGGYMPRMLNKVSHTVLCDLMSDFARDVKLLALQEQRPSAPVIRSAPARPATATTPVYAPQPQTPPPASYLIPEVIPATEVVPNQ